MFAGKSCDNNTKLNSDSNSELGPRNTYEKNIMYGPGGMALYHHCGKDNMGVNNIVHKTDRLSYMFGGCNKVIYDVHIVGNCYLSVV